MACNCPKTYERNGENAFEHMCGTEVFKTYHSVWDTRINEYLDYINNINDPILKYISLYFVQYYMDGFKYYRNSVKHYRDAACRYLNWWLQEKKDLFTFGNNCGTKLKLWENKIPTLWNMLKSDYTIFENKNKKPWCNNSELIILTKLPPGVTLTNCEESISQETYSEATLPKEITKDCICPEYEVPVCPQITDNTPDIQTTRKIAVTSGLTTAGTVGTLLLLYKVINKQ
ncbi:hypothetical protein PVPAM_040013500 [Plasmodium vivax]|nr:hypothetical protein PVPAM_040013500 [Plasmodium vivax]